MEIHHCFENPCLKSLCLSSPLFGKYFLFIIFLFLQSKSDPDWEGPDAVRYVIFRNW